MGISKLFSWIFEILLSTNVHSLPCINSPTVSTRVNKIYWRLFFILYKIQLHHTIPDTWQSIVINNTRAYKEKSQSFFVLTKQMWRKLDMKKLYFKSRIADIKLY